MNSFWSNDSSAYPAGKYGSNTACPWLDPRYISASAFFWPAPTFLLTHKFSSTTAALAVVVAAFAVEAADSPHISDDGCYRRLLALAL
jgi:hypothetical protein